MQATMKRIKNVFFERWPFYLFGYIVGYIGSLIGVGVPDWTYFCPVKALGFTMAMGLGTALYYGYKQIPTFEGAWRMLKYVGLLLGLLFVFALIRVLVQYFSGVDIVPYLRMFA